MGRFETLKTTLNHNGKFPTWAQADKSAYEQAIFVRAAAPAAAAAVSIDPVTPVNDPASPHDCGSKELAW